MKRYFFAPGTLQRLPHRRQPRSVDSLARFVLTLCAVAAMAALVGVFSGYLQWVFVMGGLR